MTSLFVQYLVIYSNHNQQFFTTCPAEKLAKVDSTFCQIPNEPTNNCQRLLQFGHIGLRGYARYHLCTFMIFFSKK